MAIAKGWAKYKFSMTNKQAFRDKLVLPTASINVFLTSLTHVGLANVGKLMLLSGHLPLNTGAGGWPVSDDGGNWKASSGGGVVARVDGVRGWRVVGHGVAFKAAIIRRSELTEEIEDGVVEYLKYLVAGGKPIYFATAEGEEVAGGKHTITKTINTRPRSRSKSRGPLGIGKHSRTGRMYVVRKKSVSIPSTETFEYVEREYYAERPEGEKMHKRRLALPAPPAPGFVDPHDDRQPRYVERRPSGVSSDGSDDSDSDLGGETYRNWRAASGDRRERGRSETAERQRDTTDARRTDRSSGHTYSARELKERSRLIRQRIEDERERAIEAMEQRASTSRKRDQELGYYNESQNFDAPYAAQNYSKPSRAEKKEKREESPKYDERSETIKFLESEYGVVVTRLEVQREPIDNGRVKPVAPLLAASDSERNPLSESDESDTSIVPGMSRDRLRAETSLPEYSTSTRDRPYKSRTRYEPRRYDPYSTHDHERFRRFRESYPDNNEHSPPPPEFSDDKHRTRMYHAPPTPLKPSMFDDGHGSRRYHEHARHHDHDHHHDGGEYFGPPTTTSTLGEEEMYLVRKENKDRRRSSKRPIIVAQDDPDPSRGLWRRASHGSPDGRRERDLRMREKRRYENENGHDQPDTYISGGIGPHGSDDEPEDSMRL